MDSLPDEILLKILQLAAGSMVQQSTSGFFSSALGYTPRWKNSPAVPKWFGKFMAHCCYKYRAPMGYYGSIGSACQYQHDFIAEVISKVSARFNRLARDPSLWLDERSRTKLRTFACHGSPTLTSLPDKILIKIVKMAASLSETRYILEFPEKVPFSYEYDHDFLIEVVAKISKRFAKIAAHPELWKGNVFIYRSTVKIEDLVEDYLCVGTKGLWVCKLRSQMKPLSSAAISALAKKCPDLGQFSMMASVRKWPNLTQPWKSIEHFYNLHWRCDDVELHRSLPNLKSISFEGGPRSDPTILPDMGGCDKLEWVQLKNNFFCITALSIFPKGLKNLFLAAKFKPHSQCKLSHEDVLEGIKTSIPNCEIKTLGMFLFEMH